MIGQNKGIAHTKKNAVNRIAMVRVWHNTTRVCKRRSSPTLSGAQRILEERLLETETRGGNLAWDIYLGPLDSFMVSWAAWGAAPSGITDDLALYGKLARFQSPLRDPSVAVGCSAAFSWPDGTRPGGVSEGDIR